MRSYLIVSILCLLLLACKEDQKVLIEEMSVPTTSESKYPSLYNVNDRLLMTWTTPYKDSLVALKYAEFDKGAWKTPSTVTHGKDWFVNWADFPSIVGNNEHRTRNTEFWEVGNQ